MDAGTVLVLPDTLASQDVDALVEALRDAGLRCDVVSVDPMGVGSESARLCLEIARMDPPGPLSLVATGESAMHLPPVARAQHAAHRRVVEYVLVKPVLPAVNDTWPDAPVSVYCDPDDEASIPSRLRGWTVLPTAELSQWRPAE